MKILWFIVFLFICSIVNAGEPGDWVDEWWNDTYKQNIQQEHKLQSEQREQLKCDRMIVHYQQHLKEDPNSDYYRWKLELWKNRCLLK